MVERFRSRPDGRIDPVEAGQPTSRKGVRRPRRTVVSAGEVKKMQPERDEIIICTALDLKASGVQLWGCAASGIAAMRYSTIWVLMERPARGRRGSVRHRSARASF